MGRLVEKLKAQVEKLQDPKKDGILRQVDRIEWVADKCMRTVIHDISIL